MNNNVLDLPISDDILFRKAIQLVEDGDEIQALRLATILIDSGYDHANTLAGYIYEHGSSELERDPAKAFFYYERAANTVGAMHGWLGLARLLLAGDGIEQDYERAFSCYKVVAEDAGNGIAWINLGRMYKSGLGTPKNLKLAKSSFEAASRAGYVVGDLESAKLMREEGHHIRSLLKRFRASVLATKIAFYDENDDRLKHM